ncbi:hypothetical protein L226DRAFT_568017 [Lentinus tigrinus ALCF2SS1-7]|uniref:uncharacterized protein n=1 Tax=Lentinus tigrinus ALCF2SS1-7 TaxID=1328758 RepID=UPI001165D08D|nr:hypothetical protein L226DRAFT_568017 [Lentinus tigrinus ALCF2SS1-7]
MLLPQEIFDHILDFLHDDVNTLRACALAHRVLLQTSRYHRFNGLPLAYPRISRFATILSLSPDLAWSVRSLSFTSPCVDVFGIETRILKQLPALADLTVMATALRAVSPYVPNLNSLRIMWPRTYSDFGDLIVGISECMSIRELELIDVRVRSHELFLPDLPPAPPLHKLRFLGGDSAPAICTWLGAVGSTPPFHSLSYAIRDRHDAEDFVQMAEALFSLAQELTVRFMPEGNMNDALADTTLTLAPFSALRSCTLRFAFGEMCVPQNVSLSWIPTILGQLSSSHLRTLRISLAVDNVEDLRSLASECAVRVISPAYFDDMRVLDWERIERALLSDQLRGLEKVILEGRGQRGGLESHIQELCPELHSRGVLSLVPVEDASWLN